ncbi:AraC family transcriptional regulator, partial [Escherichia coli]|nr:AraC family transcriptional regulator [Escherichia coli]
LFALADRPMRPGSFTLMGHATRHATTVRQALRRALHFLRVSIDAPYGTLTEEDGQAVIRLTDPASDRSAFAYRTFWIVLHGLTCWLARRRIPLLRVDFACAEPARCDDYRLFFGAPVRFDCEHSLLAFDSSYLDLPANRSERELKAFLRGAPANILVGYVHDAGFQRDIARRLRAIPPAEWPSFDVLAQQLRLPEPSLRRSMARQGITYSQIKDEIRLSRAKALLGRSDLSVADIAIALGYAEPSAFYRAFRKWTGLAPGAFRQAQQAAHAARTDD